jgi:hypothetical protein
MDISHKKYNSKCIKHTRRTDVARIAAARGVDGGGGSRFNSVMILFYLFINVFVVGRWSARAEEEECACGDIIHYKIKLFVNIYVSLL